MHFMPTIFNGLLVGASGYALYSLDPGANPYAFTACAFGLCHGLLGIIRAIKEEDTDCSKVHQISSSIMEIVPLPLINIDLYLHSQQSSGLALGHGLFIIPLAFDFIAKLFTDEGEDSATETLKDLTILGNIVSLLFLSVNEDNYVYGGMAFAALCCKYGASALDTFLAGAGDHVQVIFSAIIYILLTQALGKSA